MAASASPYLPGTDMARFVREMLEFVGLGEADVAAIRRSAPIVLGDADRVTAALYDHFLAFPRSARFFLREDGTVDAERLERRKHSLTRWLASSRPRSGRRRRWPRASPGTSCCS